MKILIFSDLDGTLLNADDYDYRAALPVIAALQKHQIPLIPVTSKTRAEVQQLRRAIALTDPFIVENGSGIFIEQEDFRFIDPREPLPLIAGYCAHCLGGDYATARRVLSQVAADLNMTLRGFGDLSLDELQALTGLAAAEAIQAQHRDFTEPFLTPDTVSSEQLAAVIARRGWQVVVGDRFFHLIGAGAGKGRAVHWLGGQYQKRSSDVPLLTIGLGNSPNDLAMLEAVDIPLIIPGKKSAHPALLGRGWRVAPMAGAEGWAAIIREIGTELGLSWD